MEDRQADQSSVGIAIMLALPGLLPLELVTLRRDDAGALAARAVSPGGSVSVAGDPRLT